MRSPIFQGKGGANFGAKPCLSNDLIHSPGLSVMKKRPGDFSISVHGTTVQIEKSYVGSDDETLSEVQCSASGQKPCPTMDCRDNRSPFVRGPSTASHLMLDIDLGTIHESAAVPSDSLTTC